ncbi:MAG TPA: class I SAM-dependent methyltransferase [Flavobacteriia bacterium]|nr:class I SAM-dependent methyltransferase [Flavobacteriia bacterium]
MQVKSPINPNNKLVPFLQCKDFTVSHETFTLLLDKESELLITSPQPKESELAKYYESPEYISHTDSTKTLIDRLYQTVKKYAIAKKVRLVKKYIHDKNDAISLLDIGCGTGDFLKVCSDKGFKVSGVEPNDKARNLALNKLNAILIENSIYEFSNTQKYDVITMWHVLEHVPDLNKNIIALKSLLKPNGILIIAVPNYKSFDANYYKAFWAAYDVPRHLWHFSKQSIEQLFSKINFKVSNILPMKFDSFYVSLLSEKYKTGKSNLTKAFFIGLLSNIKAISSKEYSSQIYVLKNKGNSEIVKN